MGLIYERFAHTKTSASLISPTKIKRTHQECVFSSSVTTFEMMEKDIIQTYNLSNVAV